MRYIDDNYYFYFGGSFILVATSTHHIVRLNIRIDVASLHREIDLALPTSSTFAELLPELARFVELPELQRPWEFTTVAGEALSATTPLYQLKLRDGAAIVLRPKEIIAPPVVRDAAHALEEAATSARDIRGLHTLASLVGIGCIALFASMFIHWAGSFLVAGLAALVMALLARSTTLFHAVVLCASAAAGLFVAAPFAPEATAHDVALGVLAAAVTAVVAVALGATLRLTTPASASFTCTVAALAAAGSLGAWLPAPQAPSALVVLTGLLLIMATPFIATRAAGLQVPRIPTAGETFEGTDLYQPDVDQRSRTATTIATAVTCAVVSCGLPALLLVATGAAHPGWRFALALCVAGALVIHGSRHRYPVQRIALTVYSLGAVVAATLALHTSTEVHPGLLGLAALLIGMCATTLFWSKRVPDLEPTTVMWLERAEALAIIAVLPLAVHLTGAFDMIRGL